MRVLDYHVHSEYSEDSTAPMREIVQSAIKKNISEFVFTDHIELYITELSVIEQSLKKQYSEYLDLKEEFSDKISLKFGMEVSQPLYTLSETDYICSMLPYDFIIFSIHKAKVGSDYYFMDYANVNIKDECDKYIEELGEIVDTLTNYSVLGHVDYLARYIKKHNVDFNFNSLTERFRPIFKTLIQKGKGIELNVSGLRTNHGATMPSEQILKVYKECGGEIITIGSDAHQPECLGERFFDGIEILKRNGFDKIAVFDKMNVEFINI